MTLPLLLLPGMMCDARLFAPQLAAIHDRAVMVSPIAAADSTTDLARIVLDAAPPRFALAGLSMGGIVAMEVVAQAPERVAGLCLMDTNPKAEHPKVAEARDAQIQRVRDGELRAVMREELMPNYVTDGPTVGAILDTCMAMAETMGAVSFVRQSRALQTRADRQDVLEKVAVPSLVLCGREDRLCPLHRHELMHDLIEGSELVVVERAGHLPTLEQPEVTTRAIRHWLDRVDHAKAAA